MATNTTTTGEQNRNFPEDYREELEREANSDGPHAWVCQRVLASMD
ncbi:hypothetical protein [Halorhabdus amylolytica]|nr:hypothetical protein [Halorhabdus amylolytica]